jgi:hypothetical protein
MGVFRDTLCVSEADTARKARRYLRIVCIGRLPCPRAADRESPVGVFLRVPTGPPHTLGRVRPNNSLEGTHVTSRSAHPVSIDQRKTDETREARLKSWPISRR